MRLGGWMRIWIVLSALFAALVLFIAYDTMPQREKVLRDWYMDASETIAEKVGAAEGRYISPYEVQKSYFNGTEQENIALLTSFQDTPSERAKIFSDSIGEINARYEERIASLSTDLALHWLQAAGVWAAVCGVSFILGWSIGWIVRGFRDRSA